MTNLAAFASLIARSFICALILPFAIEPARGQIGESLLLPPVNLPGFDRGHNLSVLELPRKAYDPVGLAVRSFKFSPSIVSGTGGTSNTYYTVTPIGSTFLTTTPTLEIASQWDRHQLDLTGTGTFREYLGQSRRNETTWQFDGKGRVDLGRFTSVNFEEVSAQLTENQFSGETTPTIAALSRYRRDFFSGRIVNQAGRTRITLGADYAQFRFQPLPLLTGESRSQANRDRDVTRVTGQVEYAQSPNIAFFVQASYADQGFKIPLTATVPNVDSLAYRVLSGVNFDDPGFARGSIGLGYTKQVFRASIYMPVEGISVQGRLDFFPSRLTTVSLAARRSIEITSLTAGPGAYWNNSLYFRTDREIWRNILVNTTLQFSRQHYIQSDSNTSAYQLGVGAKYLSSRRLVVNAGLTYGHRNSEGILLGGQFSETRGELSFTFQI